MYEGGAATYVFNELLYLGDIPIESQQALVEALRLNHDLDTSLEEIETQSGLVVVNANSVSTGQRLLDEIDTQASSFMADCVIEAAEADGVFTITGHANPLILAALEEKLAAEDVAMTYSLEDSRGGRYTKILFPNQSTQVVEETPAQREPSAAELAAEAAGVEQPGSIRAIEQLIDSGELLRTTLLLANTNGAANLLLNLARFGDSFSDPVYLQYITSTKTY